MSIIVSEPDRIIKHGHIDIACLRQKGGCCRLLDVPTSCILRNEKTIQHVGYDWSDELESKVRQVYINCPNCNKTIHLNLTDFDVTMLKRAEAPK